jgi:hypothetical protein
MTQPHAIEYMGAVALEGNKSYTSTSILTAFPTANVMKMKTTGVAVSINGTAMFETSFDDESYISSTSKSYIFNKNCVIAIGKYIAI